MLLFDILILTLVLIPWLGEDVTYRVGESFLELPDLGVPLLAAALVAVTVHSWPRHVWTATRAWLQALRRVPARAVGVALAGSVALLLIVLLWPRWAFENPGLDASTIVWRLTHGTTAILSVSLVGAALRRWTGEPWEKSFFVRQALHPARVWREALQRAPARTLWSATAAVGTVFMA
ncbi:MAG TPA: hypothetical protein VE935_05180, partial [Burkholderiales bacterium]|nr:hypothetical protein [Burkholderiales bacterium]